MISVLNVSIYLPVKHASITGKYLDMCGKCLALQGMNLSSKQNSCSCF